MPLNASNQGVGAPGHGKRKKKKVPERILASHIFDYISFPTTIVSSWPARNHDLW